MAFVGGGRGECPTPCQREGNCSGGGMSGEYVQGKCPDPEHRAEGLTWL